ncbi:ABC transporter permease [Solemya velesiana gill symbiont]|uniref:ABC transporter permease n=1 Tax=Solemya velesiana gill symbiont TaxID=1918948 RepID=A0A1T2KVA1_9GAMM|nr:ABC transporter permease subunit [Solemya velesiana gill symbiont]OOZ36775.1 ABC transporter permease [Solemya velesiana gill symbiont]
MIAAIAGRELRTLFFSPLAWSLAAVTQFLLAWIFLTQLDSYAQLQPQLATLESPPGVTELVISPLLDSAALLTLLVMPLLSMRLLSEEYRSGTIDLLLSSPVSMTQIALGKFTALATLQIALVALFSLMPLSLLVGTDIDLGRVAAGLLSLALLLAACAAVGLYLSSLTSQPTVAAVGTYGVLLFLWIISAATSGGEASPLFHWLSLSSHFHRLLSGLVSTSDIAYFLLLTGFCLALTIRRLDSRRSQGAAA